MHKTYVHVLSHDVATLGPRWTIGSVVLRPYTQEIWDLCFLSVLLKF